MQCQENLCKLSTSSNWYLHFTSGLMLWDQEYRKMGWFDQMAGEIVLCCDCTILINSFMRHKCCNTQVEWRGIEVSKRLHLLGGVSVVGLPHPAAEHSQNQPAPSGMGENTGKGKAIKLMSRDKDSWISEGRSKEKDTNDNKKQQVMQRWSLTTSQKQTHAQPVSEQCPP